MQILGGKMKIKKPFRYFGSKGRFYKEIKKVFEENKKENFVDLFAGTMEVPLNIKEDFGVNVILNVKDIVLESLIEANKKEKVMELYKKIVKIIYRGEEIENIRYVSMNNKEKFNRLKENFSKIFKENILTKEEENIIILLCGFAGKTKSLNDSFYSKEKEKTLEEYLKKIRSLEITTNFFDETWEYKDSFIFLDPPYINKTKIKANKEKGYSYKRNIGVDWTEEDDFKLINFIKKNLYKNNVFMVFGSLENNLYNLIKKNFKTSKFKIMNYKKSIFGKVSERAEWFCIIKQ